MNFGLLTNLATLTLPMVRAGLGGIAPLDKYAYAGSIVEWNGEVWGSDGINAEKLHGAQVDEAASNVDAGLWGGWFSTVEVRSSGLSSTYLTINVTLATDFASLRDVLSVVEGVIWNSSAGPWPYLAFKTLDLNIIRTPQAAIDDPRGAKPSSTSTGQLPSGVSPTKRDEYARSLCGGQYHSDMCGCGKAWNWIPPGCYPADADGNTNVTGWTTTAMMLGAIGALLVVVAINKVAK